MAILQKYFAEKKVWKILTTKLRPNSFVTRFFRYKIISSQNYFVTQLFGQKIILSQNSFVTNQNYGQKSTIWEAHWAKFWRKFRFLTKISVFYENFDFWRKFRFVTKISIFDENFGFLRKFRFLTKISVFYENFDF